MIKQLFHDFKLLCALWVVREWCRYVCSFWSGSLCTGSSQCKSQNKKVACVQTSVFLKMWDCAARAEVSWTASWAQLHKGTIEPDCKKLWSLHRGIPWQICPSRFSVLLPRCRTCTRCQTPLPCILLYYEKYQFDVLCIPFSRRQLASKPLLASVQAAQEIYLELVCSVLISFFLSSIPTGFGENSLKKLITAYGAH